MTLPPSGTAAAMELPWKQKLCHDRAMALPWELPRLANASFALDTFGAATMGLPWAWHGAVMRLPMEHLLVLHGTFRTSHGTSMPIV